MNKSHFRRVSRFSSETITQP